MAVEIIKWTTVGPKQVYIPSNGQGNQGPAGKSVELRTDAGYIQWRQTGGSWANLVALSSLIGPAGPAGTNAPQWYIEPIEASAGDFAFDNNRIVQYVDGEWLPVFSLSWDNILDKPEIEQVDLTNYYNKTEIDTLLDSKATSSHSHSIANVTGLQTALDGKQPAGSYAAADHSHNINDITNLQSNLNNKSDIGHGHVLGDIADLEDSLDSKSNVGHSHVIADTTGLQTALDAKAATSALSTVATTGSYNDLSGRPNPADYATAAQGSKADTALQASDIEDFVISTTVTQLWQGTQAEYDSLGSYSNSVLYFIKDA